MRKTRLLKHFLLLFAIIAGSTSVWADDVTFNYLDYKGKGTQSSGSEYTMEKTDVSIKNDKFYGNNSYAHFYAGSTSTITPAANITVTKIVLTASATNYNGYQSDGAITASDGSVSGSTTSTTVTWTGSASSAFTISNTKQIRWTSIVVTYSSGSQSSTYSVTYDANGATSGTVPVDANEYTTTNNTVTVLGNTGNLAKDHCTFSGWNTKADGTGTNYVENNTFTITANTTLFAKWTANTHTVTLPPADTYGTYIMSATNPVAYGTEVTLTYTPAAGYENYDATWSVNGTAIDDNTFNMPDEDVAVTVSVEKVNKLKIDFESDATAYTDWTFTNIVSNYKNSGVDTYEGEKYGSTDGKASGSIKTKNKVNPVSLTCYVSKQTTNSTSSTWYCQVSTDGTTWTDAGSRSATDMGKGEWKEFTVDLSTYSEVYVRVYYSGSTAVRLIDDLTLELKDADAPYISAEDVEIEATATSGSITYSIENPIDGTSLTPTTQADWISNFAVDAAKVTFTTTANPTAQPRTATVTLTYGSATKDVTVTQAAAPVVYTTIPALFAAATSTATNVNITFGNWVVSGVTSDGKTAYVTDNEGNGFIIYTSNHGFAVNDKLSGTVSGTPLKLYSGAAELTNLTATTAGLSVSNDGEITVITDKAIAALSGVNTGAVITLSNLTYDGTNLSDGTNTIKPYSTLFSGTFESGKTYNVTGVYLQHNTTKEILPRSADDIEEVASTEASITVEPTTVNVDADGGDGTITVTYTNITDVIADVYFYNAEGEKINEYDWLDAEIDDDNNLYYVIDANEGEARTAYMKVFAYDDNGEEVYSGLITITQAAPVAPFEITDGFFDFTQDEDYGSGLQKSGVKDQTSTWTAVNVVMYMAGRNCWYSGTPDQIRLYKASGNSAAGSITLSVPTGNVITKVAFTGASLNNMNAEDGTYTVVSDNKSATWTGASNSIKFIASDRTDIETISVTYSTTVTIAPAHEYITFSAACNLDFSQVDGLETYIVTKVNETSVSIEKIEAAVPAGTGLILKKTGTASSFDVPVVAEATAPEGNKLIGVTKPTLIGNTAATDYILYDGTFYPASQGTLPAGKAYLRVEEGNAPELGLDFSGETTGIVNVNRETITNNQYYTLDGRRVENPTNGIYIINGRKVVVK